MATYSSNAAVVKWDGVDISGFWTGEIDFKQMADLTDANRGANATHKRRNAGMADYEAKFEMYYGSTEAERVLSFNLIKANDKGTLYYAPQGEIAGQQYFEGPMIVESKEGPKTHQEKSTVQTAIISFKGDGEPTHEMEDGVI